MATSFGRSSSKPAAETAHITAFPTVLRSLRETDADLTDILDAIADGVIVRNPKRNMLYANEAAARMLGYSSIAAIMTTPNEEFDARFEFYDEDGHPVETDDLPSRRALRGMPCPEITLRYLNRVTGSTGWALVKSRPVLDANDNVRLTVTIIHDITEQKQAEEDLRQARDELERIIEKRTAELSAAHAHHRLHHARREQPRRIVRRFAFWRVHSVAAEREYAATLEDLATLRTEFTATAAQELDLQVAMIRALATTAKTTNGDSDDHRQAVDAIAAEACLLSSLVRDLETVTCLERDEPSLDLRPIGLGELFNDAATFASTLPGDHPLPTTIGSLGAILADWTRITLALHHLLDNAAKFSAPGSPIALRAIDKGSRVRIEVEDHGRGINPADLDRIFSHFNRGHSTPGPGLGLYLTRRILHMHDSELSIVSTPGEGTVAGFEVEKAAGVSGDEKVTGIQLFSVGFGRDRK